MDAALHRHAVIVGSEGVITTEYLNHTSDPGIEHPWGYTPSQLRVRRSGNAAFETIHSPTGSGFRFTAEAFAAVLARGDLAAVERASHASLDIAATLQAIVSSAGSGTPVEVAAHAAGVGG